MLLALDVEATGLNPELNEITQLSVLAIDETSRTIFREVNLYIKPERFEHIDLKARAITGNFTDEHFNAPHFVTKQEAMRYLKAFASELVSLNLDPKKMPLLGCNVGFDEAMLRGLFKDCGVEYFFSYRKIDISSLAFAVSYLEAGSVDWSCSSLDAQAKKYKLRFEAHDSRQDVYATVNVFFAHLDRMRALAK